MKITFDRKHPDSRVDVSFSDNGTSQTMTVKVDGEAVAFLGVEHGKDGSAYVSMDATSSEHNKVTKNTWSLVDGVITGEPARVQTSESQLHSTSFMVDAFDLYGGS